MHATCFILIKRLMLKGKLHLRPINDEILNSVNFLMSDKMCVLKYFHASSIESDREKWDR